MTRLTIRSVLFVVNLYVTPWTEHSDPVTTEFPPGFTEPMLFAPSEMLRDWFLTSADKVQESVALATDRRVTTAVPMVLAPLLSDQVNVKELFPGSMCDAVKLWGTGTAF